MSLDLGGPAIEIAIGLAFVFFVLSLIVSELTELVSGVLRLRASNLEQGLKGMLGDPDLVKDLLDHPLVKSDLRTNKKPWQREQKPSYIAPENFAMVLRDLFQNESGRNIAGAPSGLAKQLRALAGGATSVLPEDKKLEKWFDDSMDRVSGWYKRKAKWITLAFATLVVVALNVSALRVADQLAAEPTVRAAVVAKAEAAAKKGSGQGEQDLEEAGKNMENAVKDLADLHLPIFWADPNVPKWTVTDVGLMVVGWLITILAITLGAPFWFDALGKLSNLRMAGKNPEEKKKAGG